MRSAVDAMKMGAVDYIAKPFDHEEMVRTVGRIITEQRRQQVRIEGDSEPQQHSDNTVQSALGDLVGRCDAMQKLYKRIKRVAPADVTILIHGESGTGKELAARAIHQHSPRQDQALVTVNCAAIPESLIESELFGHEKGAFTGATAARQGLVEAAEGGTLFLDEIGELPMEAQARLLRVLQESEVRRVGSVHARTVDVRLIAATHRNLKQLVKEGRFREDLYYRLQVIEVTLPPLRERGQDVLDIAEHLLAKHARRLKLGRHHGGAVTRGARHPAQIRLAGQRARTGKRHPALPDTVRRRRDRRRGNWASIRTNGRFRTPWRGGDAPAASSSPADNSPVSEELSLEDYFQHFVLEHQQSMSETELAQKLGISRKSLWERRQRLGIPRPKKGSTTASASR